MDLICECNDFTDDHPFQTLKVLEPSKEFHGLTHFSFSVYSDDNSFDEKLLTEIDINLPKLRSLKIDCPFIASEWTPQMLSKLSNIETIELNIRNREFRPEIERQLIKNCKKFKCLKILPKLF